MEGRGGSGGPRREWRAGTEVESRGRSEWGKERKKGLLQRQRPRGSERRSGLEGIKQRRGRGGSGRKRARGGREAFESFEGGRGAEQK